jgi:hypothetical protein
LGFSDAPRLGRARGQHASRSVRVFDFGSQIFKRAMVESKPRRAFFQLPDGGANSMTVTSGRAKNRTRGAGPPSMPMPRVT